MGSFIFHICHNRCLIAKVMRAILCFPAPGVHIKKYSPTYF
jgi:hypothetical protein